MRNEYGSWFDFVAKVNYENCARMGHFGRAVPWEAVGGFLDRAFPPRPA